MAWIHLCFRAWLDRVSEDGGDGGAAPVADAPRGEMKSASATTAPCCRPNADWHRALQKRRRRRSREEDKPVAVLLACMLCSGFGLPVSKNNHFWPRHEASNMRLVIGASALVATASASAMAVPVGRCGPSFGGMKCESPAVGAVYCNLANGWCTQTLSHEQAHVLDFVAPEGRCGPKFGGAKCKADPGWALFCNEETGWCGDDDEHKNAQASTKHDFAIPDGRCGPKYGSPATASCTGKPAWAIYCNEMAGFCGNTEAHRQAQAGTSYDYVPPLYVVAPRDVADHPSLGLSEHKCDFPIKTVDECAAAATALKLSDTSPSAAATKSFDPVGCYLEGAHLKIDENGVLGKCTGYHQCICRTKFVATIECNPHSEYQATPPTSSSDRVCKPLTVCGVGEFKEADHTATTDRVCTTHGECVPGQYASKAPTDTEDRQCSALTTCTGEQYESEAAQAAKDRTCSPLTTCTDGEYESKAPTTTEDRHCATVYECAAGTEYEISAPKEKADRQCRSLTTCLSHQFASIQPSASSDRKCDTIKYCMSDEYQTAEPTTTSDRVCADRTVCTSGKQYETKAPTTTSDRVCKALTTCGEHQWQSRAPGNTYDRLCTDLTTCTDAEYEARAPQVARNRLCYGLTTCTEDEYQSAAPTADSDRGCTAIALCPAGKFRTGTAAASGGACDDCVAGTYKSNVGMTWKATCRKCYRGRFGAKGATACSKCAAGRFQAQAGQSGCAACPDGQYSELEGRVALEQCAHCPAGKFAAAPGSASCELCSTGRFGDDTKKTNVAHHCVECPSGRFQENDGSTKCESCPSGQFQHKPEQVYCHSCENKLMPYTEGRLDKHRTYWTAGVAGAGFCVKKPVDCVLNDWADAWSTCSKSCETGLQTETRSVAIEAWGGGVPCADEDKTREQECNKHKCPIDCAWEPWGDWHACSKSCGSGTRKRYRHKKVQAMWGGVECTGTWDGVEPCNTAACAVDCGVSSWGAWGTCTAECSSGRKTRTRSLVQPAFGGKACPGSSQEADCNQFCCKGHFHVDGTNTCEVCAPGTFAAVLGMLKCEQCATGTYQPKAAQDTCLTCPKGTHQPSKGKTHRSHCIDCPKGRYQVDDGADHCTACAVGQYNPNAASSEDTKCINCGPGTFAKNEGARSCQFCPVGQFGVKAGQTACTACAAGRYNKFPGRSSEDYCLFCPCGKWSVAESTICSDCRAGRFRTCAFGQTECDGGKHGDDNCKQAEPGYFATEASCEPTKCLPGHYETKNGSGACTECPAGRVNALHGGSKPGYCGRCKPGTYAEAGKASCTACGAGRFVEEYGAESALACKACASGKHAPSDSASKCITCSKGKYQTQEAQDHCDDCASGRFAEFAGNTAKAACKACDKGKHQPESGSATCVTCDAGSYQNSVGGEACVGCPQGTASNSPGAIAAAACVPCAKGSYAVDSKSTECTQCDKGRASGQTGAHLKSQCIFCSAGQFADQKGLGSCKSCAKGHFSGKDGGVGHHHCLKCPSGQFQEADGMTQCVDCVSGRYTHTDKHDMIECEKCGVLDAARKFHTRGLAGQSQCWPIAVDCAPKPWDAWGTCTKSCGVGKRVRTRQPKRHPATGNCAVDVCTAGWGGGRACDTVEWSDTEDCNTHACPIDCVVSAWAAWEPCSKSCGGGITHRVRAITVHPEHGGKVCPVEREPATGYATCNPHACSWKTLRRCHDRHVKCHVKRKSLESSWHKLKPRCAHSAVEEDNMCWNNGSDCKKESNKCHEADTSEERAQASRHAGKKFDTIVVQHDRKNMLQYGNFKCQCVIDEATGLCKKHTEDGNCACKCTRHPPCCAQKNKLLTLPNLGKGQRYTGIARVQECCNICNNHPECTAWEFDQSESVCVLKKGKVQRGSYIAVPEGSGVETYAGAAGEFENCKWGAKRREVPVQQVFTSRKAWREDGNVVPAAASP